MRARQLLVFACSSQIPPHPLLALLKMAFTPVTTTTSATLSGGATGTVTFDRLGPGDEQNAPYRPHSTCWEVTTAR